VSKGKLLWQAGNTETLTRIRPPLAICLAVTMMLLLLRYTAEQCSKVVAWAALIAPSVHWIF
jgi:hypothetical protein